MRDLDTALHLNLTILDDDFLTNPWNNILNSYNEPIATKRTVGVEIEIPLFDANSKRVYRSALNDFGVSKNSISIEDANVIEIKREIPLGIGSDNQSSKLFMDTFLGLYRAFEHTGTTPVYDCLYDYQAAGIHVRIGYNGISDRDTITTAANANMYWLSALSNFNNDKRVGAYGLKYGVGSKGHEIMYDPILNAVELRGIPTSDDLNITLSMEYLVAAYIDLIDNDPEEIYNNSILTAQGINGVSYSEINRERTLSDKKNALVYVVGENGIEEKPLLDVMEEKIDALESRLGNERYALFKSRIADYRERLMFTNEKQIIGINESKTPLIGSSYGVMHNSSGMMPSNTY